MRAFRVAYDGRRFHGFQRQPDVATVEDTLLDGLRDLDVLGTQTDTPPGYAAAGRTDTGVSALAQTVAFEAPEWLTPAAWNGRLPTDVRAWASADVPGEFHATYDAVRRRYTYFLYAPGVDDGRARAAFDRLRGEHDFHNLTPDDDGTVRDLGGGLTRDGPFLVVRLEAGGFARQLVRRAVALVAAVGRGDRDRDAVDRALGPEPLAGPDGVGPVSPSPLVLSAVDYPGLDFERDADAAATVREIFAEKRAESAARARVAGHVADGV